MRRKGGAVLTMGLLFTMLGGSQAVVADEDVQQLRNQLAEQRRLMEMMEKRLGDLEAKEKEQKSKGLDTGYSLPRMSEGMEQQDIYDGGFFVKTKDNSFSMKVNGFGQFRYTFFSPEKGKSNNNFDLALGRLAFSGHVFDPNFMYFLQLEGSTFGNNNNVTLLDWWGRYTFSPELYVQTGRGLIWYSRQFITHPGTLLFPDLSEADLAFSLYRGIGGLVGGKTGPLSYTAQVSNSIRALDAGGQQNFGRDVAVTGRLEVDVLEPYGYIESLPTAPPSSPQFSIGVAGSLNPVDSASGFQNVMPGDRTTNATLDGGFRWQRFTLQAAGYFRSNNRRGAEGSTDWGYYGQAGFFIVPEHWELAARISGVDFEEENNPDTFYEETTEYMVGLNYYLYGHNLKVQLDYSFLDQKPFSGSNRSNNRVRLQTQFLF